MFRLMLVTCALGAALATPPFVRTRDEIQEFRNFLESTKAGDGRYITRASLQPEANDEELSGKYQGDILLDDVIIEDMVQEYASGSDAYTSSNTKWPENTVVWEFGVGEFDAAQSVAIEASIKDIEDNTCIKFRLRQPVDTNYVRLTGDADGCYATIGYRETRGIHVLNLARNTPGSGCFRHATIVHEFMHILGLPHMQSAYNRDDYVRIETDNIESGNEHNFDKYNNQQLNNLGVDYDYVSCMHYGPYAFSANGQPTIVALREHDGDMGQRVYITDKDWLRTNKYYNCPEA